MCTGVLLWRQAAALDNAVEVFAGDAAALCASSLCAVCRGLPAVPQVSALFAVDAPGEVVLPSCVLLDPAAITSLLSECITPR